MFRRVIRQQAAFLLRMTFLCLAPLMHAHAGPTMHWPLCHTMTTYVPPPKTDNRNAPTEITADYGQGVGNQLYTVRGNVLIRRGSQELEADQATYNDETGFVDAAGRVHFRQDAFVIDGETAHFNLATETGQIDRTQYVYAQRHAHGEAETLVRESDDITQLYRATYTTCDPGKIDWQLFARHVTLDQNKAVGIARDVTLRFKGVPLLYLPYINFPLSDERKTGLLPPTIGYSNRTGLDLAAPFYWNIAPDRDATITPRYMQTRGLLMRGEFRYLNPTNSGRIEAEYLPNDALFGSDRGAFSVQHQQALTPRWHVDGNVNYVSDMFYLGQLGDNLSTANITHLDRRLDLSYTGEHRQFLARVQGYQTIDPTIAAADRPYQSLPQLLFVGNAPTHPLGADYDLVAEFINFQRESSLTGSRIHAEPSVSWPIETLSYFIIPKLGLNYTGYYLNNTAGANNAPQHGVPVYSLDSGLYFERDLALAETPLIQTLEPRLYYLRIPYRNQSDFPVFDTTEYDFSYTQLFRENRFTGADRLNDANQLSTGLTSRLLERDSGREWLRASIGQIYYFETPRVTLPGVVEPQRGESDIAAELTSRLTQRWTAMADLQWNPDVGQVQKGGILLHYQRDQGHLFNAGYRFRRGMLAQSDFSMLWPITSQWRFVGRWNYSYRDHRALENLVGLQYDSCCWAFRVTSRRYVSAIAGDSSRALYLQLEFKGLAAIGHSVDDLLESGILGYRPH